MPVATLFFRKFCFSLRTSYKEVIWFTNNPNVHIHNFQNRWSFIWGCFFPLSILNLCCKYLRCFPKLCGSWCKISHLKISYEKSIIREKNGLHKYSLWERMNYGSYFAHKWFAKIDQNRESYKKIFLFSWFGFCFHTFDFLRDYSCRSSEKFSEKLTFRTPWHAQEMLVFRKTLLTY